MKSRAPRIPLIDLNLSVLVSGLAALMQLGRTEITGANDPALPYVFPGGAVSDGKFALALCGNDADVKADQALLAAATGVQVTDLTVDLQDTAGNSYFTAADSNAGATTELPRCISIDPFTDLELAAITVTNPLALTTLSVVWIPNC